MNLTAIDFEAALGAPLHEFARDCHAASLALVQSGAIGQSRVARGSCPEVGGQHSWAILGDDCYDPEATVVDPTLWSYDQSVSGVWIGTASERPHQPHGSGSIWEYGKPTTTGGETIELTTDVSPKACDFLALLGPLDRGGWSMLAHAPVGGWPSAEILGAMYDDERMSALIPIDVVGMATDRNPCGLYLAEGTSP